MKNGQSVCAIPTYGNAQTARMIYRYILPQNTANLYRFSGTKEFIPAFVYYNILAEHLYIAIYLLNICSLQYTC
jgi:hypothetical protein